MEKIQDYALIGNGRSAALISKKGSLEWLCWPRFDSPSIFGAILDDKIGGFWKISPVEEAEITRNYIDETNVLETRFQNATGSVCLTDFMVALSEEEKKKTIVPEEEIIREVKCESGQMRLHIHFCPRPDYGKYAAKLKDLGKLGIRFKIKQHLFTLVSAIPLSIEKDAAQAEILLKKDEKITFCFTYSIEGPAVLPLLEKSTSKLQHTVNWWKNWAAQCQYQGKYRKEVIRSALALKLLCFAPSGAFIAAPTTSLPEKMKGDWNWDYRFCWIRDSAFTVRALFKLGYKDEAEAFVSWLLHSTRLTLPKLKVLYDLYGRNPGKETFLSHLKGYFNSKPVRIKNAAENQFQLDCYGEVMEAVTFFIKEGGQLDNEMKKMLLLFGKYICKHWNEKDNGIWEIRDETHHYTYSKVMCWVALDRLIDMNQKLKIKDSFFKKCIENREMLRKEVEKKGWSQELDTYTETFEGSTLDISLLLISLYDFEKENSDRMQKTFSKLKERLYVEDSALVYRREKSKEEKEGAFAMCSFWIVEFLAKSGQFEEAKAIFQKLLSYANDVGLFSEEIDTENKDFLGNFPQAFTHIALINSAIALAKQGEVT